MINLIIIIKDFFYLVREKREQDCWNRVESRVNKGSPGRINAWMHMSDRPLL